MSAHDRQILAIARDVGVLRPRDLVARGLPPDALADLARRGLLERDGRGLYLLPDGPLSAHHSLAVMAKRVPGGVICLISALYYHDLGTQLPYQVWMAVHPKAHLPRSGGPPFKIVRFSGEALTAGVEVHDIEGVPVPIYDVAKTVVDCFKYRNKIGLDVALEALQDYIRRRAGTVDELWHYARLCRQTNVMRPYLEALL